MKKYKFDLLIYVIGLILLGQYIYLQGSLLHRAPWNDDFFVFPDTFAKNGFVSFLPGFFRPEHWMGHPPAYPLAVHSLNLAFHDIIFSARLYSMLTFVGLMGAFFVISLRNKVSLVATFFLLLCCLFSRHILSVVTGANADMPLAFWGTLGLLLIYLDRPRWGVAALSIAILSRESALAFAVASWVFLWNLETKKIEIKKCFFLPLALLGGHFLYSLILDGSWSSHPYARKTLQHVKVDFFSLSDSKIKSLFNFINTLAVDYSIYFWGAGTLLIIVGFYFVKESRKKSLFLSLVLVQILFVSFFVFYEDHIARDFTPAILCFFASLAISLEALSKKLNGWVGSLLVGVLGIAMVPVHQQWMIKELADPYNLMWMGYADQNEFLKKVGVHLTSIKEKFPDKKLRYASNMLLQKQLTVSEFGFIKSPIKTSLDAEPGSFNMVLIFSPGMNFYYFHETLEAWALENGYRMVDQVQADLYAVKIYLAPDLLKAMGQDK